MQPKRPAIEPGRWSSDDCRSVPYALCPGVGAVAAVWPGGTAGVGGMERFRLDRVVFLALRPSSGIWTAVRRDESSLQPAVEMFRSNSWYDVAWGGLSRDRTLVTRVVAELRLSGRFAVSEDLIDEAIATKEKSQPGMPGKIWTMAGHIHVGTGGYPGHVYVLSVGKFVMLHESRLDFVQREDPE